MYCQMLYLFQNSWNVSVLESLILMIILIYFEVKLLYCSLFIIIIVVIIPLLLANLSTVAVAWQLSDSSVQTVMFHALLYVIES